MSVTIVGKLDLFRDMLRQIFTQPLSAEFSSSWRRELDLLRYRLLSSDDPQLNCQWRTCRSKSEIYLVRGCFGCIWNGACVSS